MLHALTHFLMHLPHFVTPGTPEFLLTTAVLEQGFTFKTTIQAAFTAARERFDR